jgi:hypothetical protein
MGMPFNYENGGLNPTQSNNKAGQLYYDYDTGQQYYMGYEGMNPNDPTNGLKLLGQMVRTGQKPVAQKIYVDGANKPQMKTVPSHNYIDIAALYPELMQGAQGASQANSGLLGGQGAAQSASSGAGRFL